MYLSNADLSAAIVQINALLKSSPPDSKLRIWYEEHLAMLLAEEFERATKSDKAPPLVPKAIFDIYRTMNPNSNCVYVVTWISKWGRECCVYKSVEFQQKTIAMLERQNKQCDAFVCPIQT